MKYADTPVYNKVLMLYKASFVTVLWTCYEKIPKRVMRLKAQVETNFSMQYTI